jgi:hypothetical protein
VEGVLVPGWNLRLPFAVWPIKNPQSPLINLDTIFDTFSPSLDIQFLPQTSQSQRTNLHPLQHKNSRMGKSIAISKTGIIFMNRNNADDEPEILGFLNASEDLTPEGIAAIKAIIRAGYDRLRNEPECPQPFPPTSLT